MAEIITRRYTKAARLNDIYLISPSGSLCFLFADAAKG